LDTDNFRSFYGFIGQAAAESSTHFIVFAYSALKKATFYQLIIDSQIKFLTALSVDLIDEVTPCSLTRRFLAGPADIETKNNIGKSIQGK
jgi:hypothetical protein